jgi:hypothetical protein
MLARLAATSALAYRHVEANTLRRQLATFQPQHDPQVA